MCRLVRPAIRDLLLRFHRLTDVDLTFRNVDWSELMLRSDLQIGMSISQSVRVMEGCVKDEYLCTVRHWDFPDEKQSPCSMTMEGT